MNKIEFCKIGQDRYMIIGSNNIIVSKKEMLKIKKNNNALRDIESNKCQQEVIEERQKIEKEIREVEEQSTTKTIKKTK